MIPRHQRRNHNATDTLLDQVRVLVTALEVADDEAPARNNLDRFAQAVPALIRMIGEKLEEVEKTRHREWAGLGGYSPSLSESEVTEARGGEDGE